MVGSAVATIVASSTTTNWATQSTASPVPTGWRLLPVKLLMLVTLTLALRSRQPLKWLSMETEDEWSSRPPHIRALPVFGGHLALDFANTVDDPEGPARFDHIADLRGYL